MKCKTTYERIHNYTEVEHGPPVSRRMSQLLTETKIGAWTTKEDFNVFEMIIIIRNLKITKAF